MEEKIPTSKRRITVTLTDEQHAILCKIHAASGQSMSEIISEFLLMAQPGLECKAVALQQLKQVTDADRQRVAEMLSELHAARAHEEVSAQLRATPGAPDEATQRSIPGRGMGMDALQFCASVDFVRPTNRATRSPEEDVENSSYAKQTRNRSPTTGSSARSAKVTLKRAKK